MANIIAAKFDELSRLRRASMEKEYTDELNSNFNFRCNDELKEDFKQLCKVNQISPSSALKRYMLSCIRSGKIV
ncbi:hypothetical protein P0F25_003537 [Vibrio metschnikovii]|nr:hypothetical protein [Vibrio metschnikovii]